MDINQLVRQSAEQTRQIRKHQQIIVDYHERSPWIITNYLEQMRFDRQVSGISNDAPSFDEMLTFKEDYLIDTYEKLYRQIRKSKVQDDVVEVYFYSIEPHFYNDQLEDGFEVGDIDNEGHLVTGSNLVIENTSIDRNEFESFYYTLNN